MHADYERALRVFSNLIGNAVKFCEPGDRIEIGAEPNEHFVRFLVTDARGTRYALSCEEVRWAVFTGGVNVDSSFFRPINEATVIRFAEGHGWGHGVGMCQWCAETHAEEGMAHEDIVLRSFPGTALKRAY